MQLLGDGMCDDDFIESLERAIHAAHGSDRRQYLRKVQLVAGELAAGGAEATEGLTGERFADVVSRKVDATEQRCAARLEAEATSSSAVLQGQITTLYRCKVKGCGCLVGFLTDPQLRAADEGTDTVWRCADCGAVRKNPRAAVRG